MRSRYARGLIRPSSSEANHLAALIVSLVVLIGILLLVIRDLARENDGLRWEIYEVKCRLAEEIDENRRLVLLLDNSSHADWWKGT